MNPEVRQVFKTMDRGRLAEYQNYWSGLSATDDKEYFQRFLFAFCSVHTTWKSNVKGYEEIKDFYPGVWTKEELRSALIRSGCGMHNNRTDYIWIFGNMFWSNPDMYWPDEGEPLYFLRNRLVRSIYGLGMAKVSFALEMAFPTDQTLDIACLDVHMLRLYGNTKLTATSKAGMVRYQQFESDWCGRSKDLGYGPYMTRMVYWDTVQAKDSSRYWSYVLEKEHDQQEGNATEGGSVVNPAFGAPTGPGNAGGHETETHTERRDEAQEVHQRENNKSEGEVKWEPR